MGFGVSGLTQRPADEDNDSYTFPFYKDEHDYIQPDLELNLENTLTNYVRQEGKAIRVTQEIENELKKQNEDPAMDDVCKAQRNAYYMCKHSQLNMRTRIRGTRAY